VPKGQEQEEGKERDICSSTNLGKAERGAVNKKGKRGRGVGRRVVQNQGFDGWTKRKKPAHLLPGGNSMSEKEKQGGQTILKGRHALEGERGLGDEKRGWGEKMATARVFGGGGIKKKRNEPCVSINRKSIQRGKAPEGKVRM